MAKFRPFKINLENILIRLGHSTSWFPHQDLRSQPSMNEYVISFHSPNTIPQYTMKNFMAVQAFKSYTFSYSLVKTELLDSRYDTNCFEYDLDHKFANFNMRSDCITHCYQNFLRNNCNLTGLYNSRIDLFRREFLEQNQLELSEVNCEHNNKYQEIRANCMDECKMDCHYSYYLFDKISEVDHLFHHDIFTGLTINHNGMPDIFIKHVPETQMITVLCNLGGVLGMWLGISILSIFESTVSIVFNLFRNLIIINNSPILISTRQVKIINR